jgi:cytochrome P450
MFGSGNRDATTFAKPDQFDLGQDRSKAISFGAGPHFCAGAWAARCLIVQVPLPMLFNRCPDLALSDDAAFGGWAFRGPLTLPVRWAV